MANLDFNKLSEAEKKKLATLPINCLQCFDTDEGTICVVAHSAADRGCQDCAFIKSRIYEKRGTIESAIPNCAKVCMGRFREDRESINFSYAE